MVYFRSLSSPFWFLYFARTAKVKFIQGWNGRPCWITFLLPVKKKSKTQLNVFINVNAISFNYFFPPKRTIENPLSLLWFLLVVEYYPMKVIEELLSGVRYKEISNVRDSFLLRNETLFLWKYCQIGKLTLREYPIIALDSFSLNAWVCESIFELYNLEQFINLLRAVHRLNRCFFCI